MREDNVRKIWSDAELDAALSDLHNDTGSGSGSGDGLAFARASLMAAAGPSGAPAPHSRRPGTWRWIAVAAAVVTLVGGLAVVTSLLASAPEPARPAATLHDLDRPLAPDEFHYTQRLSWAPQMMFGKVVQAERKVELWIPADPKQVWHRRTMWTGAVDGLPPGQEAKVDRTANDEYGAAGIFPNDLRPDGQNRPEWNTPLRNWLSPDAELVASLVADPVRLSKRLRFDTIDVTDTGRTHSATESLTMVRSVLELGLVSKPVRLALRDALQDIEGIFEVPGQTPDGHPATVVGAKDSGQRLYLDPATAQLLAWDFPPGAPMTTSRWQPPVSTSVLPPGTTTTAPGAPATPELPPASETLYSFAITRASG